MKLQSLRLGFATNSSSSHSVVLSGYRSVEEVLDTYKDGEFGEEEFGWGYDTYSDIHSIVNYGLYLYFAYSPLVKELQGRSADGEKKSPWGHSVTNYDPWLWEQAVQKTGLLEETKAVLIRHGPNFDGWIDHQSHYPHEGAVGDMETDFWDFVKRCTELIIDNDNH